MARTWKQKAEITLIAAVALGIVDACAPAAEHKAGEMMVSTGGMLMGMATGGMDDPSGATGGAEATGGAPATGGEEPATGSMLGTAGQMLVDAGMEMMGSGGNPAMAQDPPSKSGSRIQVRFTTVRGDDGMEHRYSYPEFYDSKLGAVCNSMPMTDGTNRCTPQTGAAYHLPSFFADAACSVELLLSSPCPAVPSYAYGAKASDPAPTPGGACPPVEATAYRFYRVGAQHTGTAYKKLGDGPCEQATPPDGSNLYAVTEMAPSEFVRLDMTTAPAP